MLLNEMQYKYTFNDSSEPQFEYVSTNTNVLSKDTHTHTHAPNAPECIVEMRLANVSSECRQLDASTIHLEQALHAEIGIERSTFQQH